MNINYELLKEDLNFPLVLDEYSSYVWTEDDGLQMVAQFQVQNTNRINSI